MAENVDQDHYLCTLLGKTRVMAAGKETARDLISRPDEYIKLQSQFDRQARLGVPNSAMNVTQDIFLAYLSAQVMAWSATELTALKR